MPRERDRFVADALHQIAVAGDDIYLVLDKLVAEARVEMPLCQRHADGIADALAERSGGGLDSRQIAMLGMAGARAADLAEIFDLIQRRSGIAGEIEQRIQQHRAMPGRQHETVAVGPLGIGGIEFQELRKKNGGSVRHSHRQPGMAGFRLFDGIHRESADGVCQAAGPDLVWRSVVRIHGLLRRMAVGLSERAADPSRALDDAPRKHHQDQHGTRQRRVRIPFLNSRAASEFRTSNRTGERLRSPTNRSSETRMSRLDIAARRLEEALTALEEASGPLILARNEATDAKAKQIGRA